jgi:uncharacterized BrkB/YihY/UPF0761 family membrane protein
MIALIFLFISASIFIFGGELNSVIGKVSGRATRPAPSKRPRKAAASR